MYTASDKRMLPGFHRFSIRLPRPLWIKMISRFWRWLADRFWLQNRLLLVALSIDTTSVAISVTRSGLERSDPASAGTRTVASEKSPGAGARGPLFSGFM
jgi:hypothetical protein